MLLVQFVSDLSVTSDGFLAYYTSVRRGAQIPIVDSGAGTRRVPQKPVVKPLSPKLRATTAQPAIPTTKYAPPEPTGRPKVVKPTRDRRPSTTGQDRRVVTRPAGKRPGGRGEVML